MVTIYKKPFLLAIICLTSVTFFVIQHDLHRTYYNRALDVKYLTYMKVDGVDDETTQKWWEMRLKMRPQMSDLGKMIFLNETPETVNGEEGKQFKILVWKYGPTIEKRHLMNYGGNKVDPFAECSVANCDITYKDEDLQSADLVLFHLHRIKNRGDLPINETRNPKQLWTFLTDESPFNTFLNRKNKLTDYNGLFNWSMNYRMDADVPVPYGRTVLKATQENLVSNLEKKKDVLVAIMGSNCGGQNKRWDYVKQLKKYIDVDVYGGCGTIKTCPGHFASDCKALDNYLFYLAFENSNCDEYVTEKLWWNAFQKNSIPIVMGSDPDTYQRLLPPESYLDVRDFANPQTLASYIKTINNTGEYKMFYQWRKNFKVLNEHGYFQSKSKHYCRICEALNYNQQRQKVYNKLETYWSTEKNCHPSWKDWHD